MTDAREPRVLPVMVACALSWETMGPRLFLGMRTGEYKTGAGKLVLLGLRAYDIVAGLGSRAEVGACEKEEASRPDWREDLLLMMIAVGGVIEGGR